MRQHTYWRWHLDEVYVRITGDALTAVVLGRRALTRRGLAIAASAVLVVLSEAIGQHGFQKSPAFGHHVVDHDNRRRGT